MIATNESRQHLVEELIEQSAQIDRLVTMSRQATTEAARDVAHDLETLRAKQRELTQQLHASEETGSNSWENIGGGG
jgi:conjugal transfer/entry exclusion protein